MKETSFDVDEKFWKGINVSGSADMFLRDCGDEICKYFQDKFYKKTGLQLDYFVVASVVILAFSGHNEFAKKEAFVDLENKIDIGLSFCQEMITPAPTLSPVDLYAQAMDEDVEAQVDAFTAAAIANGSPDYSGLGYESCAGDYDCLSGEQACKAGVVPSSNSMMPGYCVPNE